MIDPKADTKRRLIVARVLLIGVAIVAAYVASTAPAGILSMVAWAFSIAASGLFPALVMGIWWKRTTSAGACAGMVAGFGICLFYLIGTQYFEMPLWWGVKNISCGLFGIPAAFIVTWVVSLMTPAPSREMQDFIDSIRVPRGGVALAGGQSAVD
jgi:cation/acetate symporter